MIDTFQLIRANNGDPTYGGDYQDVQKLKQIADKFHITVLLVHHLRKQGDRDPFNRLSGTTGITGAADNLFVLDKQEVERGIFLQTVRTALRRSQGDSGRVRQTEERKPALSAGHDGVLGGAVGASIRAVSALGRLTEDDDSDDPEEQKRKYEATQAASNVGAIIGLTIGAIEAFSHNNQSLNRIPDEEKRIEEEENFNEFLARMDEEYGYEEDQQQTM